MYEADMFDSLSEYLVELTEKTPEEAENEEVEMILQQQQRDHEFETDNICREPPSDSASDHQHQHQRPKRKRYHRHTRQQIQEMEAFFKECPNPDDKQREDLAQRFGLDSLQVKFWFQNKRTQMKTQHERHENAQLRNEIEKLRAENKRYKEALSKSTCPDCGSSTATTTITRETRSFDEQHLRVEIERLREEIDRISGIAAKYVDKTGNMDPGPPPHGSVRLLDQASTNFGPNQVTVDGIFDAIDLLRPTELDKPVIIEQAVAAMEELARMAQAGEPLWVPNSDNSTESLSEDEYLRTFCRRIQHKASGLRSEASRESAVVLMNHINLVEILMDVNQWSRMFTGIISRAKTLKVLSTGVAGNNNGALQVMIAEYQVPSLLVPTRENYFVRYCKQHADGTWAVADVSLDNLQPTSTTRYRKRPSGCLIKELPNGYSKVTWVEHVEVEDRGVHNMYKSLINAGLAFGAKRWVATLDRQCERLASEEASSIPADIGVITTAEGRRSLLKLAERMVLSFYSGVGASTAHAWTNLPGSGTDDIRVMIRNTIDDSGSPPGIVLSAATSFQIPVPPKTVFDFLRDDNSRIKWDILSNGGKVQEMAHIANGRDPGNCVSLLRVSGSKSSQSNMVILQETCSDSTGSYIIYAPVDILAMNVVLSGSDPDYVAPLPSGFSILPDGPTQHGGQILEVGSGGSLLTIAFQVLVDSVPTVKLSLGSAATVKRLIKCTVERIKAAVASDVS